MNKKQRHSIKRLLITSGTVLVLVIVMFIIARLLSGNITTSNDSDKISITQSLHCSGDQLVYPFFESDKAKNRFIEINAIFQDNKIDTISLVYRLYYGSNTSIQRHTVNLNAAMNKAFALDGINADSLNATYSSLPDYVQMKLYAKVKAFDNNTSAKFFLLENLNGNYDKNNVINAYSSKNLNCILNE